MPLFVPFILGGLALAGVGVGVVEGVDGCSKIRRANERVNLARYLHERSAEQLEKLRRALNDSAVRLGEARLAIMRRTFGALVQLLEELQRRGRISEVETLESVEFLLRQLEEFEHLVRTATTLLNGVATGAMRGALLSAGVYGVAGSVGYAGTGVAISGLSGAAAKSATLAWLGGGSLATGGFGMAGGTLVLGGLIAAPIVLLGGFALSKAGEDALYEARKFEAQVSVEMERMSAAGVILEGARKRTEELHWTATAIALHLDAHIAMAWSYLRQEAISTNAFGDLIQLIHNESQGLKSLLNAPVLCEDGTLNENVEGLLVKTRRLLP